MPSQQLSALIIILMTTLLSGCQDELRTKRLGRVSQVGELLSAPTNYPVDEFNQAYATCLALRAKNSTLRGEYLGTIFNFEIEHTSCGGDRAVTTVRTTLASAGQDAPLLYEGGPEGGYFKDVATHAHGQLANICQQVLQGQTISNTYQNGTQTIQVRFISSDVPKVLVYTAQNSNDGQQVVREDQYVFQLNSALGTNIQGIEQEHKQLIKCPNGAIEVLRQLFLHNSPY